MNDFLTLHKQNTLIPKINLIEALGSGHFWRLVAVWAIFGSPTQPIIFK